MHHTMSALAARRSPAALVLFTLRRPPLQQFRVVDGRVEASTVASLGASAVERASRILG